VLSDLKEGKVTLPLIYALENAGTEAHRLVQTVLEDWKRRDLKACGRKKSLPWCTSQERWTGREMPRMTSPGAPRPA